VLSIIIPTLNATNGLAPTFAAVRASKLVSEILVVDGGSTDGTQEYATSLGARVIVSQPGRGMQLSMGAENAKSEWLMFLHADTILEPGWSDSVKAFVTAEGSSSHAGYFRFQLNDRNPWARWLEKLVARRSNILGLPYGDQGLLLNRSLYKNVGGFCRIPLMEDVDMVRRIGRKNLVALDGIAVTSADRYRKGGYLLRMIKNSFCLSLYFLGASPKFIAKVYK
jgi:rSAM/selenodomain-associated transferase 2